MTKWFSVDHLAGVARVSIFDNLGVFGTGAEALLDEIGNAKDIHLFIDSIGGDAKVGTALYDALRGRVSSCHIVQCGSSAVPVAMAAKRITIAATGTMLLHPPSLAVLGTAADLIQSAAYLERLNARWIDILCDRTGDLANVCKWLSGPDVWLTAVEALAAGLVDEIEPAPAVRPTRPARSQSDPSPVAVTTDDGDDLLFDMLRAIGPLRVADRRRTARNLSAWFNNEVHQIEL